MARHKKLVSNQGFKLLGVKYHHENSFKIYSNFKLYKYYCKIQ